MPAPPNPIQHPLPTLPLEKTSYLPLRNTHTRFLSVKYPTLPGWWLNLTHTSIHRWFYACPSSKRFYPLTPALYRWALHPKGKPPGDGITFGSEAFRTVSGEVDERPCAVLTGKAVYGRCEPMKLTFSAPVARQIVQQAQQTLTPPETPSPPRQASSVPALTVDHAAVEAYLRELAAPVWPDCTKNSSHVRAQTGGIIPSTDVPATAMEDSFDWNAEFAKYGL